MAESYCQLDQAIIDGATVYTIDNDRPALTDRRRTDTYRLFATAGNFSIVLSHCRYSDKERTSQQLAAVVLNESLFSDLSKQEELAGFVAPSVVCEWSQIQITAENFTRYVAQLQACSE
jgi:hypothetical protein